MNDNKENHPLFADEARWNRVNQLIDEILSAKETETMMFPLSSQNNPPVSTEDRGRFLANINRSIHESSPSPSLIEMWMAEYHKRDWLAVLSQRLQAARQALSDSREAVSTLYAPLTQALEELGQRMQPAPAYRSATAHSRLVFRPRRRDVEPADLPVFNPLFCTSIPNHDAPVVLSGLQPDHTYTMQLRSLAQPDWHIEETVRSTSTGELHFHFHAVLQTHPGTPGKIAWVLTDGAGLGAWTSGVLWLEGNEYTALAEEMKSILDEELYPDEIHDLLAINEKLSRGFAIHAYERARQTLLFQPPSTGSDQVIPLRECLWQFIVLSLETILPILEQAAPVIRQMKPEWDAISPLQTLREQIRGKD